MILVTSAAGHTGRIIVQKLVDAGFEVKATDINPAVTDLPGIKQGVVADLTRADQLDALIANVDSVVEIPPLFVAEEADIGRYLTDRLAEAHKQFIFVSVTHPILSTLRQHIMKRDIEEHMIYTGMLKDYQYTILQPMHYMHNFNPNVVHETGAYNIFYDINTKLSYVAPEDVGDVVVEVAQNPEKHNKATYELVGNDYASPADLVALYNRLTGEHAVAKQVEMTTFLNQAGIQNVYSRDAFRHLASTYSKWGLDGNPNVLRFLLGREPTTYEDYMKQQINF
ncbi:MAG TPA: NmrA family protein [Lactobacillus sp.]|nr:NmrA family protein [Lactobacillus sp.]